MEKLIDAIRSHPRLVIAEDYELCLQKVNVERARFRNGEKTADGAEVQFWGSLRLQHRNRPGLAFGFLPTEDPAGWLVSRAFDSAEHSLPDPWYRLPLWKKENPGALAEGLETPLDFFSPLFAQLSLPPDVFDENSERWSIETTLYRRAERESRKYRKRFHVYGFTARLSTETKRPVTLRDHRTLFQSPDERASLAQDLARLVVAMRNAEQTELPQSQPVAWTPRMAGELLQAMSPWFFAGPTQAPFFSLEEKPRFSPAITLVDDATLSGLSGSQPFDLEGTWARPTEIIKAGKLGATLCDTYYATKENRRSTANRGRLPYSLEVGVQLNNLYLAPGVFTPGELCAQFPRAYFFEAWDGMQLDLKSGKLSAAAWGWELQNGNPVRAIRSEFPLVDAEQLLCSLSAVGNDLQFFGNIGAPSIFFEKFPKSI